MKKQKDILLILITGFIITILWVIFNIYHNNVTSTINEPLNVQIREIPGHFDTQAIEDLKKRERTQPVYELDAVTTPEPIEELGPEASLSAETSEEE